MLGSGGGEHGWRAERGDVAWGFGERRVGGSWVRHVRRKRTAGRGMHPRRGGAFEKETVDPFYGLVCGRRTGGKGKGIVREIRVAY